MTTKEAIRAMLDGKKVRVKTQDTQEYVHIDDYEAEVSQLKDELQNYKDILESPKHIKRKDFN